MKNIKLILDDKDFESINFLKNIVGVSWENFLIGLVKCCSREKIKKYGYDLNNQK